MATSRILSIFCVFAPLILTIFAEDSTIGTTTVPDLQCFIPGECTNSAFVGAEPAVDINNCLQLCKDTSDCAWFTFVPYAMFCELFTECVDLAVDNCANCISGQKQCEAPKCDVVGLCQVRK